MQFLFRTPEDYVEDREPVAPGPLGLSGGDSRRWTHEIRVPGRVYLRTNHLQAVFASRSVVAANRPVEDLFKWCAGEGVDRVTFDHPAGDDFAELSRQSLDYIRARIY